MARSVLVIHLILFCTGCAATRPARERPWPAIYRTDGSHCRAGSVIEVPKPAESNQDSKPLDQIPVSDQPTEEQVERAILLFQGQRISRGPSMDTAWGSFIETLFAYLDQPAENLSFSPLIRARVALEFELDSEQRSPGGAPLELEETVGILLARLDQKVRMLRAKTGTGLNPAASRREGKMAWPLAFGLITSKYGSRKDPIKPQVSRFHNGVDLAAPPNEPVYAVEDGVVVFAGWGGSSGHTVRIHHRGSLETVYGHLSTILAKEGWEVARGEVIGLLGKSGRATGHHLHFALYQDGQAVDPLEHLESIPVGFSDSTPGILFGYGSEEE